MSEFVFLRPWAFIFLLPAFLFSLYGSHSHKTWFNVVDIHLLSSLTLKGTERLRSFLRFFILFLLSSSVVLAMVGVAWHKKEAPLYQIKSPAVIILDLSLSMRAKDVSPNRLSRAVFKTYDLLKVLKGTPVGLIVFSDEPYPLIPTTTDTGVIETVLPLLNFSLMPSQGSRLDRALEEGMNMINSSGAYKGDIFLITDGGEEALPFHGRALDMAKRMASKGGRLFVLGIGTRQGGALTNKDDSPILDRLQNPVRHELKDVFLKRLALTGNGAYASVGTDDADISFLNEAYQRLFQESEKSDMTDEEAVADEGYWFILLPVLCFPLLFSKGRILTVLILLSTNVQANSVTDLFETPSGKIFGYIENGAGQEALKKALEYDDFRVLYNAGTLFIQKEDYAAAVLALKRAVELKPHNEDALINLEIAERLMENPPDGGQGENGSEDETPPNEGEGGSGNDTQEGGGELNQNNNNSSQSNEKKENSSEVPEKETIDSNQNKGKGKNQESNADDQIGGENQSDQSDSSGSGTQALGTDSGQAADSQEEEADGLPRIQDDPTALLKRKIMFLYLNKRYPDDEIKGAEW